MLAMCSITSYKPLLWLGYIMKMDMNYFKVLIEVDFDYYVNKLFLMQSLTNNPSIPTLVKYLKGWDCYCMLLCYPLIPATVNRDRVEETVACAIVH